MLEKMKAKLVLTAVMIAVIAGLVTGGMMWMCENGKCMCKKAKKALKKLSDEV